MKRKLKWTAVVLVILLLGSGVVSFLLPRDRITREAWNEVRLGMKEKQVEDILGGPARDLERWKFHIEKFWPGQAGRIQVEFDLHGCVTGKAFWEFPEKSFLDSLRDWLGW
jgi:hypothetical protein